MKGDFHVRFRENLRVKLPWVTRLAAIHPIPGEELISKANVRAIRTHSDRSEFFLP